MGGQREVYMLNDEGKSAAYLHPHASAGCSAPNHDPGNDCHC